MFEVQYFVSREDSAEKIPVKQGCVYFGSDINYQQSLYRTQRQPYRG